MSTVVRGDPSVVLIANPGADLYGSDRMAVESVHAFVDAGRRVVVTVPEPGPLVGLLEDAGAEVVVCRTPIVRKGLLSPRGILELAGETLRSIRPGRRLLRETGAGIVVVNTVTPPLWLALARLSGRYTVCHVHEGEASVARWLQRALYLPVHLAHRIVINSEFSLRTMVSAAPGLRERTRVVYNAVAGPDEPSPPRHELTGGVRLVYVGRLSHRKGPHIAVDALARLHAAGVEATLRLVGAVFPGNERYADQVRALAARLGVLDAIEFVGFRPSVWDELASSDIVLIPSTVDEPFGNTAVEAALAARPAVVSAVGGLPEAARSSRSALLVAPRDAAAVVVAVRTVIREWSSYAAEAEADAIRVRERFSRRRYAAQLRAALDLSGAAPQPRSTLTVASMTPRAPYDVARES